MESKMANLEMNASYGETKTYVKGIFAKGATKMENLDTQYNGCGSISVELSKCVMEMVEHRILEFLKLNKTKNL